MTYVFSPAERPLRPQWPAPSILDVCYFGVGMANRWSWHLLSRPIRSAIIGLLRGPLAACEGGKEVTDNPKGTRVIYSYTLEKNNMKDTIFIRHPEGLQRNSPDKHWASYNPACSTFLRFVGAQTWSSRLKKSNINLCVYFFCYTRDFFFSLLLCCWAHISLVESNLEANHYDGSMGTSWSPERWEKETAG